MSKLNIKDLLDNYQVNPSPDFWNKLDNRLSELFPDSRNENISSNNNFVDKIFNAVTSMSTTAKVSAILTFTAIVASIIVISVNIFDSSPNTFSVEKANIYAFSDSVFQIHNVKDSVLTHNKLQYNNVKSDIYKKDIDKSASDNNVDSSRILLNSNSKSDNIDKENECSKSEIMISSNNNIQKDKLKQTVSKADNKDSIKMQFFENRVESSDFSKPVKISIPNTITPNNDGYNDYFVVEGIEQLSATRLTIWDSKKRIIFTTTDYKNNWGADANTGIYYFQFEYKFNEINEIKRGVLSVVK